MKVALISTSDSSGGAAKACFRLMEALHAAGHKASMVVQDKKTGHPSVFSSDTSPFQKPSRLIRSRFDKWLLTFKRYKPAALFSTGYAGLNIADHAVVREADIIHIHWVNRGFISLWDIEKLGKLNKPVVWTFHDMWAFTGGCHYSFGCERFLNNCGRCPVLNSDLEDDLSRNVWKHKSETLAVSPIHVITPSNWMAKEAKKSSLFREKNIVAIPNAINTSVFIPGDKSQAKRQLNISPEKFVILFGAENSTSDHRKGFSYLMEGMKHLSESNPELIPKIECLVFGSSDAVTFPDVPFKIHNAGNLNSDNGLVLHYNAADVFVIPSLQDNLPNTIVESMACGTPVVAFDSGGASDLVKNGITGYLAPLRSTEQLAAGIKMVFENAENRMAMSNSAREKIEEELGYLKVSTLHTELYEQLLKKR